MSTATFPLVHRLDPVLAADAHEGPVYLPEDDALCFTTRAGAIRRAALDGSARVDEVPAAVCAANGMTLAADRRSLIVCEQGSLDTPARISVVDPATGRVEPLADASAGLPLNSPNDVAVAPDGAIWFTDPSYGFLQGFRPAPRQPDAVHRLDPSDGRAAVAATGFDKPNGLCFAPGGAVLYVNDSGVNQEPGSHYPDRPHHVRAFDVADGWRLAGGDVVADVSPGQPDGMKCDAEGRVYVSCASGVLVLAPSGERLGEIPVAGAVNFCFGGPERDRLFITTDTAVWSAVLHTRGA